MSTAPHEAELLKRITHNPQQCGGKPCIRGLRIRVVDVLDLLAANLTPEQIVKELEIIDIDDVRACILYASWRLNHPVLVA